MKQKRQPTYMGDMMHCSQHDCKRKDTCYRYWLGTMAKYYSGLVTMFHPEKTPEDCEYFLNIKDY